MKIAPLAEKLGVGLGKDGKYPLAAILCALYDEVSTLTEKVSTLQHQEAARRKTSRNAQLSNKKPRGDKK